MAGREQPRRAIVVGAGVIGASIAYHLAKRGVEATILDAQHPSAGASGASDGAVSVLTKATGPLMALGVCARNYYRELAGPGGVLHGAYHERPAFLAATSQDNERAVEERVGALAAYGVNGRLYRGAEISPILPQLCSDIPLVLSVENEGHALGFQVVHGFLRASRVMLKRRCNVTGLLFDETTGRCNGVESSLGAIRADDVIIAAGIHSSRLVPHIPISSQLGQLIITDRISGFRAIPGHLFFADYLTSKKRAASIAEQARRPSQNSALVIDPLRTGQLLIGSSRENSSDTSNTNFSFVRQILKDAVRYLPGIADLNVIRVFAGIRSISSDAIPVLGPINECPGLWIASGFGGDGISLAPLAGRELSRMIMGEQPISEIMALSPARFDRLRAA